jgi:hypothetical protein
MSTTNKISAKEKKIVELHKLEGLSKVDAYCSVMKRPKVEIPGVKNDRLYKDASRFFESPKVIDYSISLDLDLAKRVEVKKDDIINELTDIVKTYQFLLSIALKDDLSEQEIEKFNRLKSIIGTKDKLKALEMLAKLLGFTEDTTNIQVNVYRANFGGFDETNED